MGDNKVHFVVVESKDYTYEGYSLTTLAQARKNYENVTKACNLSSAGFEYLENVRLKNGYLLCYQQGEDKVNVSIKQGYVWNVEFKLLTNSKSGKEELAKEDCLVALAYAAEHDEVDVVEELVQYAGPEILRTPLPFPPGGTILHVCTSSGSFNTLEKLLTGYPPESVDVFLTNEYGDTALHKLVRVWPTVGSKKFYRAACLLLGVHQDF